MERNKLILKTIVCQRLCFNVMYQRYGYHTLIIVKEDKAYGTGIGTKLIPPYSNSENIMQKSNRHQSHLLPILPFLPNHSTKPSFIS